MNFEFLIEDISGKTMLEELVPKIIDTNKHSYRIISYKGIGSIPKGLKTSQDASKRALLNQLPKLLSGYGKTYQYNQKDNAIIVVCDLDNKNESDFINELNHILQSCNPAPQANFCLAIEEGEAWLLGDIKAIKAAYPKAKDSVLNTYQNDSICGTWELLADAIYTGGSQKLKKVGFIETGLQKTIWAKNICPHMDINNNKSPSFNRFKQCVQEYAG
ncbi:MAG: DUF4276 family protein [Spirochaetaceae bacterium]|nr:DUF4276 family protein [Spirochaetaceae bacterium]